MGLFCCLYLGFFAVGFCCVGFCCGSWGGAQSALDWVMGTLGMLGSKFFLEIDFDGHLFDGWSCWVETFGC